MKYNSMAELDAAYMRGEIDAETYDAIGQAHIDEWRQRDLGWLALFVLALSFIIVGILWIVRWLIAWLPA